MVDQEQNCANFRNNRGSEFCKAAGVTVACGGLQETCHFGDLFEAVQTESCRVDISIREHRPKFGGPQFEDDPKLTSGSAFMPDRIGEIRARRVEKGIVRLKINLLANP